MDILQRISSVFFIISVLLVCCGCFIPYVDSISCYRCDALDSKKSDCPGWVRRPINSVLDLGDRGGLYTHCIDVRLANGTVLHQDVVPTLPSCKASFIQTWHDTLVKRYSMEVSIICCEWNRCNGPNARAAFGSKTVNSKLVWSLPIFVITVITCWGQYLNVSFAAINDNSDLLFGMRATNVFGNYTSNIQDQKNKIIHATSQQFEEERGSSKSTSYLQQKQSALAPTQQQ